MYHVVNFLLGRALDPRSRDQHFIAHLISFSPYGKLEHDSWHDLVHSDYNKEDHRTIAILTHSLSSP